ncbi:NAD(P)-binding domain-containing protein [bacterium]|nr:NAD(P)-binding domain-containing protein [bacterium]
MFRFFNKSLKYLIIGAGSTGATFACFLKDAGKNVTLISKYESVISIARKNGGIKLKSNVKGDKTYRVNIKKENQYKDKADVIILCIRTPDMLSTIPFIEKVSHKNTVVFSISNGFGIGHALKNRFKNLNILDANFVGKCRWFDRQSGEYLQLREYCELNFSPFDDSIDAKLLNTIKDDFTQAEMRTTLMSKKMFDEISFERLITRSAFEATCIYYDINAHQIVDEKRALFEKLCSELLVLAKKMNINVRDGFLQEYYDNFELYKERDDANVYSSILNDFKLNQKSEIDFLFFIVIELAKKYNVELPNYFMIAEKFKEHNTLSAYFNC